MSQPARRPYQPRRRGFDDDQPSTPDINWGALNNGGGGNRASAPAAFGPALPATVKWFNPEKGFGFVAMGDGSGDAFLHCAVLQRAGHDAVAEGASLQVKVGPGQKGLQVTEVVSVDTSTAAPSRGPRAPAGPRTERAAASGPSVETTGTVKWFNPTKGFGFIAPQDGGKDIFVHMSVLGNLRTLNEGQVVRVSVRQGAKGPEAGSVSAM
jgi:CspA family cold shock protein